MKFDRIGLRLLDLLQRDGRLSVSELAAKIGLSPTPCARRIHQIEQSGVVAGYAALLDPARIGLRVQAFVQVKLERHTDENIEEFRRELEGIPEVLGCYATTGAYDFMLHVVATDLEALGGVVLKQLMRIFVVRDVHSSIVLETLKHAHRFPLEQLLDPGSQS